MLLGLPPLLVLPFLLVVVPSMPPETRPDIQGFIKEVTRFQGPGNVLGEISVTQVEKGPFEFSGQGSSDARITITGETEVYFEPLKRADFAALQPGQFIQVWLQPILLPSDPLQAHAESIVIRRTVPAAITPPHAMQGPIRVGAQVQARKLRVHVPPVYPEGLNVEGVEDDVLLQVTADEAGNVVEVTRIRGLHVLAQAAKEAVRQWKYEPTHVYGRPVSVIFSVAITVKPE